MSDKNVFISYGNYRKQDLKVEKKGENHHVAFFLLILCVFLKFLADFFKVLQSYQTKLEAWTRICLSSGTHLFPPKSRLLSRNLFALSTWVSKWVIIASCSHFFKTLTIIIIATPTVRRQRPTPKVINWNSSCNVQKEVFIRFSLESDIKVGHTNQIITGFDILNQIWGSHIYSYQWSQ